MDYAAFHQSIPFETKYLIYDGVWVDFRFWIVDFGFKVFCLLFKWIERSDTADPKSPISNPNFTVRFKKWILERYFDNHYI
jgi:hypothetical protein